MARTTQECLDYIRQQPWYDAYKENIKLYPLRSEIEEIHNRNLISSAFRFRDTIEGSDYWYAINKQYVKWYDKSEENSDNKENSTPWFGDDEDD